MDKITIFPVHYDTKATIDTPIFRPIQEGKQRSGLDLELPFHDGDRDTISHENEYYAELTAMYWVWKNMDLSGLDYVGFCQYRRFLKLSCLNPWTRLKATLSRRYQPQYTMTKASFLSSQDVDVAQYVAHIYDYDIIYNHPITLKDPIKKQYLQYHIKEDWDFLEAELMRRYPPTVVVDFFSQHELILGNLFIMKPAIYEAYCTWLFDILDRVKPHVQFVPYPYQRRVFGFMSERLFTFFMMLHKRQYKTKAVPFIFLSDC